MYPTGLAKYYDLYSWDGLIAYTFDWPWNALQSMFLPYTLMIPIDVWLALFGGASMDNIWKIFLFYEPFATYAGGMTSFVAAYFHIEMQDGWGILYN